jgi:NTE family protein
MIRRGPSEQSTMTKVKQRRIAARSKTESPHRAVNAGHDHAVLVLQGGGALGSYQAGVYEGMAEAGVDPDWVTGVSIGAINAALIAGNPPQQRLDRLREFWDPVSSAAPSIPPSAFDPVRPAFNRLSAAGAATFGVPGFFAPRLPPPLLAPEGSLGALSFYDAAPLEATLEELVDFDLINHKDVRLSLGAVNVRTGNSLYFDNRDIRIRPEHVIASGALPPGFAPVPIDGEFYWDGGIVSNTPLWYVLDDSPQMNALVIQVDLFSARGELPRNIDEVFERAKDIQYSSKTRFNTTRVEDMEDMRGALKRVIGKLPAALKSDPDVRRLTETCKPAHITIAHLINHRLSNSATWKDYEFSRATMHELWTAGLDDVRRGVANRRRLHLENVGQGIQVVDLTQ